MFEPSPSVPVAAIAWGPVIVAWGVVSGRASRLLSPGPVAPGRQRLEHVKGVETEAELDFVVSPGLRQTILRQAGEVVC